MNTYCEQNYFFRQLFDYTSYTFTYILGSRKFRQCVIIDPVAEHLHLYLRILEEHDLKLVKCLDTHVHADHVSANGLLRENSGCAIVMPAQSPLQDEVSIRLEDGDEIEVSEDLKLKAIYTPGHTNDSYTFFVGPHIIPGCSSGALFTGDTLFIRGTGRTDFQNGNPSHLFDSLEKLLSYPEDTWIFPAHDYKGECMSTICEEKAFNPRVLIATTKGREAFIDHMSNLKLAHPKLMDIVVPVNLKLGLGSIMQQQDVQFRGLSYLPKEASEEVLKDDVAVVDLRDDYEISKQGKITAQNPFHFSYSKTLHPSGLEEITDLMKIYRLVILYCAFGERSSLAINRIYGLGGKNVKHIQGGMNAWNEQTKIVS